MKISDLTSANIGVAIKVHRLNFLEVVLKAGIKRIANNDREED